MNKKDYELIAMAVKRARDYAAQHPEQGADVGITIVHTLAHYLTEDNAKFMPKRFIAACGV